MNIIGNVATSGNGVLFLENNTLLDFLSLKMNNTNFSDNMLEGAGGGIYVTTTS